MREGFTRLPSLFHYVTVTFRREVRNTYRAPQKFVIGLRTLSLNERGALEVHGAPQQGEPRSSESGTSTLDKLVVGYTCTEG
jgi:hypothetical protein